MRSFINSFNNVYVIYHLLFREGSNEKEIHISSSINFKIGRSFLNPENNLNIKHTRPSLLSVTHTTTMFPVHHISNTSTKLFASLISSTAGLVEGRWPSDVKMCTRKARWWPCHVRCQPGDMGRAAKCQMDSSKSNVFINWMELVMGLAILGFIVLTEWRKIRDI